jgi:hypothetical protein
VSDVFNEVDEELRHEQVNKLFRKFLPLIITLMVLIVGGVAGYQGWTWWSTKQKNEAAETYDGAIKLLEAQKWSEGRTAFEAIANSGPKGYAALAKMQAGAAALREGKSAEAAALYTEAAKAFDDPLFADLANLKAVYSVIADLTLADIDAKLGALAGAGRPYRALARELMASKAMEEGDLDRARDEYTLLSLSLDAPSGAQQRAQIALSLLGPAPKKVEPVVVEPQEETNTADPANPEVAEETK